MWGGGGGVCMWGGGGGVCMWVEEAVAHPRNGGFW